MKEIIIECMDMETEAQVFEITARCLGAGKGMIHDLDSLYDYLVSIDSPVEITFEDIDLLDVYLDDYSETFLGVFEEAAGENDNIELI